MFLNDMTQEMCYKAVRRYFFAFESIPYVKLKKYMT